MSRTVPDRAVHHAPAPLPHSGGGRPAYAALTGRGDLLEAAHAELLDGRGVLLCGPAGIGKSTLLAALGAAVADEGATVLRCSPALEDARLPYLGVIDLFARVPPEVVAALPPGPRAALRAALLHGPGPVGRYDGLAVRVAVLAALRRLAEQRPVVLVVDGLEWLDEPSADVLAFVAHRVEDADIRILAAERVADGEQSERSRCCPPGTAAITVPPLADDDVALLLLSSGAALPPPVLRAVQQTAAGNPLYALALGRGAPRDGLTAESSGFLPVPADLRALLLGQVRTLPAAAAHVLLVAAAAGRPSLTLLRAAGLTGATAALTEAERLGVVAADPSGAVRFTHPLLRAALYADASGQARRAAHALLAAAVGEPVERARHLALARPHEDEATAAALTAAAGSARADGDAEAAAELAELAARRTPAGRPADRDRRLLAAADFACDAGRREESERAARAVLGGSASAHDRVRARLVLLRNAGQALWDRQQLIEDGLRDAAGDPGLEAALLHWAALRGLLCGALAEGADYARHSARCAARAGDTATRIAALSTLARIRSLGGEPAEAEAALELALALAEAGPQRRVLRRMRAILDLDADRVGRAREQVVGLLDAAEQAAEVEDAVASLVALTRVQVRAGECGPALRTAARCTRVVAEAGTESAPALYAAALAETYGGTPVRARRLAVLAVRASEADGDRLFLLRALAVLGQAALFAGDRPGAAEAVESLRRVLEIGTAMRAADPPLLSWYADLAESLVTLGETDAAATVLQEAYRWATGNAPGSVLASLERAGGLREAACGRVKEGTALLLSSAARLRPLGLPVELVRTLTALGAVERRARHRTVARTVLAEALEIAERAGAAPLAERARDELARVDAVVRGAAGVRLTPSEARIVELVRSGATNREVATELFISVKTVEGALSRVFRKYGVRSRTALIHAMAAPAAGRPAPAPGPQTGAGPVRTA
ncbi:helix-turn-helix transcriptional regulator [Actinacidiphila sp. ITFR-21]|uniref:helix-turn-helix transcriptional regulator n=1 Tax=Actinacidiphila sp. ITFR-21 TaxID=3075199 RepID=UPI00288BDA15|nr:AAA family ATPase [Streptomyces sp. ITFR-21]WNI16785.1 AAA family ATPase [Streptomyces sp. ITFR-21]